MRKLLAAVVVILIAAAFGLGWWPQRQALEQARAERAEVERQLSEARAGLARAEASARLGRLFGGYLALEDAVVTGNYGEAQTLSSSFFDSVRDEAGRTADAAIRPALEAVLMRRDAVTAGLARSEPSVREVLAPIGRELRRALGYPAPALTPARPAPAEATP